MVSREPVDLQASLASGRFVEVDPLYRERLTKQFGRNQWVTGERAGQPAAEEGTTAVVRVFDMECNLPITGGEAGGSGHATQGSGATFRGREQEDLAGYGMSNYGRIFTARDREEGAAPERVGMPIDEYAAMLKEAGVEKGMIRASTNTETAEIQRTDPDLFVGFAVISPFDGMRGVRELERLVRDEGLHGLSMSPLTERIPLAGR